MSSGDKGGASGDEEHYGNALDAHLGPDYQRIKYHSLESSVKDYGNRIYIAAHKDVMDNITDVRVGTEATGVGGVWINKGGVAISFDYGGTRLCFVNSHLAAHQSAKHAEKRNSDYSEICGGLAGLVGNDKQALLNQFHHVFWMGDLNYRLNYDPNGWYTSKDGNKKSPSDVLYCEMVQHVVARNFEPIRASDQLNTYKSQDKVFYGFEEGDLLFPPTFKSEREKIHTYKYQRSPAWCDRVLWRSAAGFTDDITQTSYGMCPEIVVSDHKPVYATFNVKTWARPTSICDTAQVTIQFRNCKGKDLTAADVTGKSDPMIKFNRQPFLKKSCQGKQINQTLNPTWSDGDIPTLTLTRTNANYINRSLLWFQMRDKDTLKTDDVIGYGMLNVRPLQAQEGKWVQFDVNLTGTNFMGTQQAGLPAGTFSGEAMMTRTNTGPKS